MKKNFIRITTFTLIAIFSLIFISNVKADAEQKTEINPVKALFEEYYHNGVYTKDTTINLTETAQNELIEHFHAQANELVRTTYYSGDALWMSRGANVEGVKYSYYGTHYTEGVADGVTNATANTPLVAPENAPVVLQGENKNSMEEYYTTLNDFVNNDAEWVAEGNGYKTNDPTVLKYFLDFTAPCLLDSISNNYFSYDKATIEEVDNKLVMKLWVTSENYGAISNSVENAPNVLSQATITSHSYSDWHVSKQPTLCENGLRVKSCSCGDELFEEIEASADFARDFSVENQDGAWTYAAVDRAWEENFDFVPLTDKNNDAWLGDGREVKAGWINAAGAVGISYTAEKDVNTNVNVTMNVGTDLTKISLRIIVKNSEGAVVSPATFDMFEASNSNVSKTYDLKAGDTIYFLFSNENWEVAEAYPNGALNISLTPDKTVADFANDFSVENQDGAWTYAAVDRAWEENFDFVPLTDKNNDAWLGDGREVKAGWISAAGAVGISYTAEKDVNTNVNVTMNVGTDLTRISLRIIVKNSDGVIVSPATFDMFEAGNSNVGKTYDLKAGDTIYFLFSNENWEVAEAYPNGALNITLS